MPSIRSGVLSTAIVGLLGASAGCGPIIDALRNSEVRTITLDAIRTGVREETAVTPFGICVGLNRTPFSSFSWSTFTAGTRPWVTSLAGHEVRVQRGESCHERQAFSFQAAAAFDLTSLPPGAVTRAEFQMRSLVDLGTDAPFGAGTAEQCNILTVGRATTDWLAGTGATRVDDFIAWTPIAPSPRPFGWGAPAGPFDVTRTVQAWRDGRVPDFGFVIAPRPDAVARNAAAISEAADQYQCPLLLGEFRLEVSILTRR